MILRFMAPFVGLLPPVLARVPIGFLRPLSQKRKLPSGGAFRASPSIFSPLRRRFRPRPPNRSRPYCNSTSVSEHVVMMILSLVRNYIPSYQWGFALTSSVRNAFLGFLQDTGFASPRNPGTASPASITLPSREQCWWCA